MKKVIKHKPFYYPQTCKRYQCIDTLSNGVLLCRVCKELPEKEHPIEYTTTSQTITIKSGG